MATKEVLALKYRPKMLSEVIGQPVVVKAFTNAVKSKTLHHAYILAGNYGCGKTTVARIVAAMENCEENSFDPCGACDNCKAIFAGKSMEVIEMDAGSGGKVDEIRELHKSLYQRPVMCRTKYVIIDEAHSLTGAAAEASLKMIEEPPASVRFILCTTEPQAFKDTIHSRCITWTFNKVPWIELFNHLKDVAQKEDFTVEEKALQIMARYAKGSVRSGLQNLQTTVNYTGNGEITAENTIEALGAIDEKNYFLLVEAVAKMSPFKAFQIINSIFKDGRPAKLIMEGIYDHLNSLLLAKICAKDLTSFNYSEGEIKRLTAQASKFSPDLILRMMNLVNTVAFGIEYSLDPEGLFNKFVVEAIISYKKAKK